ncbi:MAG: hypothetical protein JKY65_25730 [Planctomycetes bacterium]|nr:hypothetical protein [Planctomycetota bacterium]
MTFREGITHTNFKGRTFHLCEVTTKAGRKRYVFARQPRGQPLEDIPPGHEVVESANGVVSLRKNVDGPIGASELDAVRTVLARHRRARCRVEARGRAVVVLAPQGGNPEMIEDIGLEAFTRLGGKTRYEPVLRFRLVDVEIRQFSAERMCYRASLDGWLPLGAVDTIERIAVRYVPKIDTDAFFELL